MFWLGFLAGILSTLLVVYILFIRAERKLEKEEPDYPREWENPDLNEEI